MEVLTRAIKIRSQILPAYSVDRKRFAFSDPEIVRVKKCIFIPFRAKM